MSFGRTCRFFGGGGGAPPGRCPPPAGACPPPGVPAGACPAAGDDDATHTSSESMAPAVKLSLARIVITSVLLTRGSRRSRAAESVPLCRATALAADRLHYTN